MCVCVCVCVCVYIYIYIPIYLILNLYLYLYPYINLYICMYKSGVNPPGSALSHLGWVNPNPLGCGRGGWYSFYETATRDMEVDIQRSSALLYWLLCISMHGFFSMEPCLHFNVIVTQAPFSFWRRPRLRWPATVAFVSPSMEAQKGLYVSLIRPRFAIYGFSCFWPRTR